MKQGKRLTRNQKIFLTGKVDDVNNWRLYEILSQGSDAESLVLIHTSDIGSDGYPRMLVAHQ